MLEQKVAQLFPKIAQKVGTVVLLKKLHIDAEITKYVDFFFKENVSFKFLAPRKKTKWKNP